MCLTAAHVLSMVFPDCAYRLLEIWDGESQRPCLSSLLPGWRGVVLAGGGAVPTWITRIVVALGAKVVTR